MLRELRKQTKTILWIVVVAFVGGMVFLQWGMGGNPSSQSGDPGTVGKVNGVEISSYAYSQAYQRALSQWEAQRGRRPSTEDEFTEVSDEAWSGIVAEILIGQEIRKRDIRVLDEEVLMQVKGNPPPEVRQLEIFQTDGRFDHARYLQACESLDPRINWMAVENNARMQLPRIKLEQEIISSVRVTDEEVREAYVRQSEDIKVSYAFFGPGDFLDEEISSSDEEIRAYYDQHIEDYRLPDRAALRYVRWSKAPSIEDSVAVRDDLEWYYQELEQGADFAELAENYSEDKGSASKGGDLGFFGKGDMVKEFEEVAFSLEEGGISEPVLSRFGYHIIKVEEKKPDEVRARHILLEVNASPRTLRDLWTQAAAFDSTAAEIGFEAAAQQLGLEVETTDLFTEGGYVPGVGRSKRASTLAFEEPIGTVIGPFDLRDVICVCEVASREASHIQDFEEVEERVTRQFESDQRRELARAEAERVAALIAEGKTLEQAAPSESIRHHGPFSETDARGGVTGDPAFLGTAFALPVGEISDIVDTRTGYAILRVDERIPMDEEEFEQNREALRAQLLMRKQQAAFSQWFDEIYEAATIKDLRRQATS